MNKLEIASVDLQIALARYLRCKPTSKEALDREASLRWKEMAKYNSHTNPIYRK